MKIIIYIILALILVNGVFALTPNFIKPEVLIGDLTNKLVSQLPPDLTTAYNFATNPTALVEGKI